MYAFPMPSTKKTQKAAAARAWAAKSKMKAAEVLDIPLDVSTESDIECTGWTGGVNYVLSDTDTLTDTDTDDEDWKDTDSLILTWMVQVQVLKAMRILKTLKEIALWMAFGTRLTTSGSSDNKSLKTLQLGA
jgi:hypothetical protein